MHGWLVEGVLSSKKGELVAWTRRGTKEPLLDSRLHPCVRACRPQTMSSSNESGGDALPEWTVDLVAGWSSGAAAVLACQPVDTVLTRWQAAAPPLTTATATTSNSSSSMLRGMAVSFYQQAGLPALWRGASPMIVSVPVQNALLMTGYGFGQRWFGGRGGDGAVDDSLSYSKRLGAIFVGGCTGGELLLGLI